MDMLVSFPGNKKVYADYKGYTIETDQAVHAGGDGTAPAPFDLFLASLATCSGVYVVYFCQNREIPYEDITVRMRIERDPESKMIGRIGIAVELPPEFPEKYVKPLLAAVNLCTVKKHLYDPPEIEVTAVTKS
ncbi:MAG: OsmC family protein [Candidatus Krumholzibacteriota bacterium]|nr:OsmC family protein [Candidatus Krumholzibacteriota bacterium]